MINVTVNGTEQIKCNKGDNLYQVLTAAGHVFAGNCGMKGRCNRCLVWNQDTGSFVKSCQYIVDRDISIRLEEEQLTSITGHKMNPPTGQSKKPVLSVSESDEESGRHEQIGRNENTDRSDEGVSDRKTIPAYGIAIDIGTTTIGMELVDLNEKAVKCSFSTLNSQIAAGADVVARIQAAGTKEGLEQLRSLLFSDIQKGVDHMLINTPDAVDHIRRYVLAGNATMLSIAEGLTTENLFGYPFTLKNPDVRVIAQDDFIASPSFESASSDVICLPNIAAFSGADIAAGAAAAELDRDSSYRMLIDLGTNGEILLCNKEHGVAASAACGSAFEGCFRAANVFGSNIFDMLALLLKRGQMDADGVLAEPYFESGISMGSNMKIDMETIRAFQLGKSAILSGILMLEKEIGIELSDISEVCIAGGFGFHLNLSNAVTLGLFPKSFQGKMRVLGNTSLEGAYLSLIEPGFIDTINRFKEKIRYVDLSNRSDFNTVYIEHLPFRTY